jgi:anti-anti-sigma factor
MNRQARTIALPSGAVLVQLSGDIDLAVEAALRDHFTTAIDLSPHLAVDMRHVEFIDCAGLGTLMWARNRAVAQGGNFVLVSPSPQARRLLDLTQLGDVLPAVPDVREAVLSTVLARSSR